VFIAESMTGATAARKIGVREQTCCRWKKEYGGMQAEQAKQQKDAGAGESPTDSFRGQNIVRRAWESMGEWLYRIFKWEGTG